MENDGSASDVLGGRRRPPHRSAAFRLVGTSGAALIVSSGRGYRREI